MRKMSLRANGTEVIPMAKGMVKLEKVIIVVRDKAMLEESTGVIATLQDLARRKQAVLKDNIRAQSQWVTNP